MIYIIVTISLFTLYHVSSIASARPKALYYASAVFLFAFAAFRFDVGCDWEAYNIQFDNSYWLGLDGALQDAEFGWWALMYFLSAANLDFVWLNVFSAAVFFIGVHVLARRQPNPLGMLAFLFPLLIIGMPMSGIRQGAAIGLLCIAATCIIDRKALKYFLWASLAATIHSSAAIFLLITPALFSDKIPAIFRLIATAAVAFLGIYSLMISDEIGQQAISRYVNTGYEAYGAYFRLGLLSISGVSYFVFLRKHWKDQYPSDYVFVSVGAMCMVFLIAAAPLSTVIADRLGYYLIPIQAIIFSRIATMKTIAFPKFVAIAPSLAISIFFISWTSLSNIYESCYLPYQSWLF